MSLPPHGCVRPHWGAPSDVALVDIPILTTSSFTLPGWTADRFDLPCNEPLLDRLPDDMARHAGPLLPAACWQLPDDRNRQGLASLLPDFVHSPLVDRTAELRG